MIIIIITFKSLLFKTVVLNRVILLLEGHMAPSGDIGCHNCVGRVQVHIVDKDQDATKHPALHKTAKNDLVLNINNVNSEQHWLNN